MDLYLLSIGFFSLNIANFLLIGVEILDSPSDDGPWRDPRDGGPRRTPQFQFNFQNFTLFLRMIQLQNLQITRTIYNLAPNFINFSKDLRSPRPLGARNFPYQVEGIVSIFRRDEEGGREGREQLFLDNRQVVSRARQLRG